MSGTPMKRRWPWVVLAVVVLFAGPPLAWRYRPLNATERRLVGTWITPQALEVYRFTPDRRFQYTWVTQTNSPKMEGSWRCSADRIHLQSDLGHLVDSHDLGIGNWFRRTYQSLVAPPAGVPIRFDGSTVDFGQGPYLRADPQTFRPEPLHDPRP